MSLPTVSVVVPALNEAEVIAGTLDALQPLRARGHEVVVVDGGSADATAERAAPLADRVLAGPRGRARQMNAGAAAARGGVLWFVHADTRVAPDALEQMTTAVAAGGRWGWFDVRLGGRRRVLLRLVERSMNLRSRLQGIGTGDQGLFVERELFDSVGGFPDQPLMEDLELCRRLRCSAGRPACLRGPLVTSSRRWERNGVLRTILLMWRLRAAYALGADPAVLHARYQGGER